MQIFIIIIIIIIIVIIIIFDEQYSVYNNHPLLDVSLANNFRTFPHFQCHLQLVFQSIQELFLILHLVPNNIIIFISL